MLRIGTRNSPLALAQAQSIQRKLAAFWPELSAPDAISIVPFVTEGDRSLLALSEIGGKGLFTAEIEAALADGSIDLAVHSLKDMPTYLPENLVIASVPEREDPRDLLLIGPKWRHLLSGISGISGISGKNATEVMMALPPRCKIGTAALRRKSQLLHLRPDMEMSLFRGNVGSRVRKLEEGEVDATLLAQAGINRLGLAAQLSAISIVLESDMMLPAVAQGALALEIRRDHAKMVQYLAAINHAPTQLAVTAERAMLAELDGSCRTPIAGFAEFIAPNLLRLRGLQASLDGQYIWHSEEEANVSSLADAEKLGQRVGKAILAQLGTRSIG